MPLETFSAPRECLEEDGGFYYNLVPDTKLKAKLEYDLVAETTIPGIIYDEPTNEDVTIWKANEAVVDQFCEQEEVDVLPMHIPITPEFREEEVPVEDERVWIAYDCVASE